MTARTKGQVISGAKRVSSSSLSGESLRIFKHVVANVDPDHFSRVDLPLLEQYATAAAQATAAAVALGESGAVVDGKASPWLAVQEKSVRAMVALSARLRICPQSRFDRLAAGANSRVQPLADRAKPWEYTGVEEEDDGLLA